MNIKEDDYLLVIRYSDIYEDNCIDKHIDVLKKNGCPEYYNKLMEKNVRFSTFFKIKSIYNLVRENIGIFYVASSLSNLSNALHHSMTSMMLVKAKQDYLIEEMK